MKLAIIHFLPLEYYPPITNLLTYLVGHHSEKFKKTAVFTTHNTKDRQPYNLPENAPHTTIHRTPFPSGNENSAQRIIKYLRFNLSTLISLILLRPGKIMYFESYSAWPVFFYTKYLNRKSQILIHNHEYAPKEWYTSTMKQVKYFHKLEKKWLYPKAIWNSQTNPDRLKFFHDDHPTLSEETLKVMPNYPPKRWQKSTTPKENANTSSPLKMVYVGSISFQSTYIRELCEWVIAQKGKILFDIYAYNLYEDVKEYLNQLNSDAVNFYHQGVEYDQLPDVLNNYHVGLILYKAHNANYTYNAPNKLFEYLACGLDVWFPQILQGPKPYIRDESYPKVLPIAFENLDSFNRETAANHEGLEYKPTNYFCEDVYGELVDFMIRN